MFTVDRVDLQLKQFTSWDYNEMPLPPSVPNLDVKARWAESTAGAKLVGLADWSNQSLFIFLRSGAIPGWRSRAHWVHRRTTVGGGTRP